MGKKCSSLAPQSGRVRFESETKKGKKPRDRATKGKVHLYPETSEVDVSANKVTPDLFPVFIVFIQIVQKEIPGVSLEMFCPREKSYLITRVQVFERLYSHP